MPKPDSKSVLRANVETLMRAWYGKVNKTAFGRDTGIEIGGAQRVLSGETNVGVDMIDAIARRAALEPWQLLVPDMQPDAPPELRTPAHLVAQDSARQPLPAGPLDEFERQLLQFFRGMSADHRDDLLLLANRWYAQDRPGPPSPADPFPRRKRYSR